MTMASAHIFDDTVVKTRSWLADIEEKLDTENEQQAYQALRVVLHTLRDHITIEESAHLAAQLPMLVRGIYFEGWKPSRQPVKIRREEEFVQDVRERLPPNTDARKSVEAVFKVLDDHVTEGKMKHLKDNLPEQIRGLWK